MISRVKKLRNVLPVAATGLAVLALGCGLKSVDVPPVSGPSELGLSLKLTANPDILYADGTSQASITVEARGPDGQLLAGRDIFFDIADESGSFAAIGSLNTNRVATGSNGAAQVTYTAPARTDITANTFVSVVARPVGNDATGQIYRQVLIELRSAETKLFPPNPNNKPPTCNYAVQAPSGFLSGRDILFQDTSSDPDGVIVRYEWDFGDGSDREDKPDVNHAFASGTYDVIHIVTDNNGAQTACSAPVNIQ